MSEDFGPTFITVTDEDGNEIVLEFVDALDTTARRTRPSSPPKRRMRTIRTTAW